MTSDKLNLKSLLLGKDLTEKQSQNVFRQLFEMKLTDSEARTLLLLLADKGEAAAEISGCLKALRSLEPELKTSLNGLMDTCGTGGDQSNSINVSTLSAILIAAAGGRVAKHGNRSITSKVGSSDLLEALGIPLETPCSRMMKALKETGFGYFHAPLYHPVFGRVQPLRKKIGVRTIFNYLGPLVNPLKLERQMIGVSRKEYLKIFADVQKRKKMKLSIICHSRDGMDEISTACPSNLAVVKSGKVIYKQFNPSKYGFRKARREDYRGGSLRKNLELSEKLLKGRLAGPCRDLVAVNAGVGLFVSGAVNTIDKGIEAVETAIERGDGYRTLEAVKKICRKG